MHSACTCVHMHVSRPCTCTMCQLMDHVECTSPSLCGHCCLQVGNCHHSWDKPHRVTVHVRLYMLTSCYYPHMHVQRGKVIMQYSLSICRLSPQKSSLVKTSTSFPLMATQQMKEQICQLLPLRQVLCLISHLVENIVHF